MYTTRPGLILGYCLDILDYKNLKLLKSAYDVLRITHDASNFPQNRRAKESDELLLRELDCAVIETVLKVTFFRENYIRNTIKYKQHRVHW